MSRLMRAPLVASLVVLLCLATQPGRAQLQKNDGNGISAYVASVAKTVYSFAWPSATYKSWEVDGVHPTDHGFEVSVKLTGTSAFDGEDLWLKLALVFSNGQFERFRLIDDNAILMKPFATSAILGSTALYLANQYASSSGQPGTVPASTVPAPRATATEDAVVPSRLATPQEGICLMNTTGRLLTYEYLQGAEWKPTTLISGNSMVMWRNRDEHPIDGVPQYYVRYLDGSGPDALTRTYKLPTSIVSSNPDCKDAPNYHFGFVGDGLQIFTGAATN